MKLVLSLDNEVSRSSAAGYSAKDNNKITIAIIKTGKIIAGQKIQAKTEKLLLTIDKLLKKYHLSIKQLQSIKVDKLNGTFSQVRAIVTLVNILSFTLGAPIFYQGKRYKILPPQYTHELNITSSTSQRT